MKIIPVIIASIILSAQSIHAKELTVGVKEAPPFAMKQTDGSWRGISIDLWKDIARESGYTYQYREFNLEGLLNAVKDKKLDVAVAALTITHQREKDFDFTHAFYNTGLGIVISNEKKNFSPVTLITQIFSLKLISYIAGLFLLLAVVGGIVWLIERKKGNPMFRDDPNGIADGIWFSAATMTTVGYGDKVPKTRPGRVVGLFWMFSALIITSFFTAGIASSLTIEGLSGAVNGPGDLPNVRVGTVEYSYSTKYLNKESIIPKKYETIIKGLEAVRKGDIDAFVYDHTILQYYIHKEFRNDLSVLDAVFSPQSYGIALQSGSRLRENINRLLLKKKMDEKYWKSLTERYLGSGR